MKKTFAFLALAIGAVAITGCDSEKKAQTTLTKFEHVFQVCKEETLKQKLEPGKHPCALVSSVALDKTLRETGIGEEKMATMRDAWIKEKGFSDFYIPEDKR